MGSPYKRWLALVVPEMMASTAGDRGLPASLLFPEAGAGGIRSSHCEPAALGGLRTYVWIAPVLPRLRWQGSRRAGSVGHSSGTPALRSPAK